MWLAKKLVSKNVQQDITTCEKTCIFTNNGPCVQQLETIIRDILKISDDYAVICCCNATIGLDILSSAIMMNTSIEGWITQSFTFPSSAQLKSKVLINTVDSDGYLSLVSIPTNYGIIVTNVFGNCADIAKYISLSVPVIFDNAASPYSFYQGKNISCFGDGSVISLHHTKPLGFAEGGVIVVNNKYAENVRRLINFGCDLENPSPTHWNRMGTNGKMNEITAIYIQHFLLENAYNIITHHRQMYQHIVKHLPKNYTLFKSYCIDVMPSCLCVICPTEQSANDCIKSNPYIEIKKYYKPLIEDPIAWDLYQRIICIPCHIGISTELLNRVLKSL